MQEWLYDIGPIISRRNKCRAASGIKDHSLLTESQWHAHTDIQQTIRNLDKMIQNLHVESITCRRKNARTTKYKHLIRQIEQTIDEIEQLTTMYGLEFFK